MERGCKNCGKSIAHKKVTAQYCCGACRVEFWRYGINASSNEIQTKRDLLVPKTKPKEIGTEQRNNFVPLKGVLEDKKVESTNITPREKNPVFTEIKSKLSDFIRRLAIQQNQLIIEKQSLEQLKDGNEVGRGALIGGGIGALYKAFTSTNDTKEDSTDFWSVLGRTVLGVGIGATVGAIQKNKREQDYVNLKNIIPKREKGISWLKQCINNAKEKLSVIPMFLDTTTIKAEAEKIVANDEVNALENEFSRFEVDEQVTTNSKIICSNDLKKMKFRSLDFKSEWFNLLGQPSVNFQMVVHGKPGQGKSTFCLQFAHYLASNFGRVVYISGEEGFSKTMKDKFQNNNAYSPNLFLADINSFDDIIETISPNEYHFIFVDSLNNMGIGLEQFKELRYLYSKSALITIAQSTKKGDFRGSQEVLHETDIALKVEDGYVVGTKNRFKELGYSFSVFE